MAGIYMLYDGIDGAVTTSGFEKWIEILQLKWGFERDTNKAMDGSTSWGRPPSVHEVTVTKRSDKATTLLIQKGLSNEPASTVKFKFTATAKDKVATYLAVELSDCLISSFNMHGAEGVPEETLKVNFTKIMFTFTPRDAGLIGSPTSTTYDLKKATTS